MFVCGSVPKMDMGKWFVPLNSMSLPHGSQTTAMFDRTSRGSRLLLINMVDRLRASPKLRSAQSPLTDSFADMAANIRLMIWALLVPAGRANRLALERASTESGRQIFAGSFAELHFGLPVPGRPRRKKASHNKRNARDPEPGLEIHRARQQEGRHKEFECPAAAKPPQVQGFFPHSCSRGPTKFKRWNARVSNCGCKKEMRNDFD